MEDNMCNVKVDLQYDVRRVSSSSEITAAMRPADEDRCYFYIGVIPGFSRRHAGFEQENFSFCQTLTPQVHHITHNAFDNCWTRAAVTRLKVKRSDR